MRFIVALISLSLAIGSHAQSIELVDAPQPQNNQLQSAPSTVSVAVPDISANLSANLSHDSSSAELYAAFTGVLPAQDAAQDSTSKQDTSQSASKTKTKGDVPVDAEGKPIPLEHQQPKRILGFMPNFRSVSSGSKPHPPGWKYNFTVATHQATDYSTFIFLGLTSLVAEGTDEHPNLHKGVRGFYAYTWRGFLDKSDGTYLSAWLLPSLLHEDTRFYALGSGHSIVVRSLYIISRQGVSRTYGGRQTPNIAGLGGKVLTQVVSRTYYPKSATSFQVLATKFGYSVMRDVMFSSIREFYPDIAAHYIRKHREKVARLSAKDVAAAQ